MQPVLTVRNYTKQNTNEVQEHEEFIPSISAFIIVVGAPSTFEERFLERYSAQRKKMEAAIIGTSVIFEF